MSWFKRNKEGVTTSTREKKEAPDGLWFKNPKTNKVFALKDLEENCFVFPDESNHHYGLDSEGYAKVIFDKGKYEEIVTNISPKDFLHFKDLKRYEDRIIQIQQKTKLSDAMRVMVGKVNKEDLVVACMDFKFIGGSMGSVVGEKISRAIDYCIKHKFPLLIISKSGGARMMESAFSLMQMAKTSVKLTKLAEAKLPYFSLLTDPTTGGVSASYAMLGDINMAEPGALIGFAGPRVIKETIKRDLPEGFQSAEFVLEKGFLDLIVDRRQLKDKLSELIVLFKN